MVEVKEFDVILNMNWLSTYKVVIHYFLKTISIELSNKELMVSFTTKANAFVESIVAFLDDSEGEKGDTT